MRFVRARRSIPVALFALLLACGGASRPAVATAEAKHGAADDKPLVTYDIKDDADYARALREFYTKYEFRIPMRDGKKLHTHAYVPKDRSRTYPIVMTRTPYGVAPYGIDNYPQPGGRTLMRFAPARDMVKDGYVIVHQDVRGRMASEGEFVDVRPHAASPSGIDESTDAFDTVDFLVKNVPNNNGKVGVWGISYPGFYAAQAAVNAHPAVKAVSPQAPVTDWFLGDDFHHNGALFLADAFGFMRSFGKPRPEPVKKWTWVDPEPADAYDFFLALGPIENTQTRYLKNGVEFYNDIFAHPNRDAFWKARDPRPFYKNAKPAVLTVGGLFDAEDLWGAVETYRAFEAQSPGAQNTLVLGPWRHGGWSRTEGEVLGDIHFGAKTSLFFQSQIESPFFARALKGREGPAPKEAWVYDTGLHEWRGHDAWPPQKARPTFLGLRAHGVLSSAPLSDADMGEGGDSFPSDPQKPVPYRSRSSPTIDEDYMTDDQRFASRRPDVLVYQTPPLESDAELAGPVGADLWVTTTGTDADFVVKLVDVWPDDAEDPQPNPLAVKMAGYQELVRFEIMRARYRSSFEVPEPMKPGEPTHVKFTLPDVAHTFRTGHRLMVQVQSSMFPLVDRNPQTFVDIYKAKEADFRPATHRVLHDKSHVSGVLLPLVTPLVTQVSPVRISEPASPISPPRP
jgi:hypothetical protein